MGVKQSEERRKGGGEEEKKGEKREIGVSGSETEPTAARRDGHREAVGQRSGAEQWGRAVGWGWGRGGGPVGALTEAEEERIHTHPKDAEEAVGDEVGAHQHRLWGNRVVMGRERRGAAPHGQRPLVNAPWPTPHGQQSLDNP